MSDIREDLLKPGINKKRIIAVLLTVAVLITAFAFSTYFFNLFFGSARISPNDKLDGAPEENPELNLPPIPWSIDDLLDLFQDLNLSDDEIDELIDMNDWDVDDLDLSDFASLAGALLFSDVEVFWVSQYDNFFDMEDKLWRYESFDQYNGTSWTSSGSMDNFDFYTYNDYNNYHSGQDIIEISIPMSPNVGSNAFVIPNLFPRPFIMENSVMAPNLNIGNTALLKDDFNCTTLDVDFTSEDNVNMSYQLFGLDLPTDAEINSSAVNQVTNPSSEYINLVNSFTQLPPNNETYVNGNTYFQNHFNNLYSIINPSDNNFVVADKIRDYLASNFAVGLDAHQTDPPGDNEDTVYWFCEKEEGIWSDFASAFAVFSRTFGVPSRFSTGYNSWGIEELPGENKFAIKYKNIYNWIEIFVPTDINGNGRWVQMDVFSGTIPAFNATSDFRIRVSSNKLITNRGESVNITATLRSDTLSVANRNITFIDAKENVTLGESQTDSNGNATFTINVDSSYTVGPQIIAASYSSAYNATVFLVEGDIRVNLTDVTPQVINISDSLPDETLVEGYLYDPISNESISNAEINFRLFEKGTDLPPPFTYSPITSTTDNNGQFNEIITLDPSAIVGDYEIRVDFNGTFWIYGNPIPVPSINGSSNRMNLTLVEEIKNLINFYINDFEASNYLQPTINRGEILRLKVEVLNSTSNPQSNVDVEFYDYSNAQFLGTNQTNSNGIATWDYTIDNSITAGPNILYVKQENLYNYSYYILNAPINITLNSCPNPAIINRSGTYDREFIISGKLQDALNGNPIKNGQLTIHMFNGGFDYAPSYLTYVSGNYITDPNGDFSLTFRVDSSTPAQNYTMEVWFNGTFIYTISPLPNVFDLSSYSNFSYSGLCDKELQVLDPEDINIILKIGGQYTSPSYSDLNPPPTYNFGEFTNIEVWVNQSGSYAPTGSVVRIWDIYTNTELDSYTFNIGDNGYHLFQINTNNLHAGLHRLNVTYETFKVWSTYNSSYLVINESINLFVDQDNMQFTRNINNFVISGRVRESGEDLRGLVVNLVMLDDGFNDVTSYLNFIGGSSIQVNIDGTFQFSISSIDISCPQGQYYIRVDFNGTISESGIFLTNYMVSNSSSSKDLEVFAGTDIIPDTYYSEPGLLPTKWVVGDTLFVLGNLTWDNGTAFSGIFINVTVQYLNGTIIAFNDTVQTDIYGGFNVTLLIDDTWPTPRSETEIWVYFNPLDNGLNYVEETDEQYL